MPPILARLRRLALAALAAGALLALVPAMPALGASTHDLRGTWEVRVYVGASLNNVQYWRLDAGDPAVGTFSGTTATTRTGSPFGTMTATANGVAFSAVNPYTGGGYTASFTGTVGGGGTTMSGTWTANGGTSANNWTAALVGAAAGRRPSAVRVSCDRGPDPASASSCTATVQDGGAAPPVTPTGRVEWTAGTGSVSPAACDLAPVSQAPGLAACGVTHAPGPGGTPAGTAVPVIARYSGDGSFAGSEGRHEVAGPEGAPPPVTPAQVVCVGNQIGACEGVLPAPGPVTTCVGNQIGACNGIVPPPPPLQVCVANIIGACQGFAAGAGLAGVWTDGSPFLEVEVACPAAQGATSRPRRAHQTPPGCRVSTTVRVTEEDILRLRDTLFREWLTLARMVDSAIAAAPPVVRDGGGNPIRSVLRPDVRARIARYNTLQGDFLALARQLVRSGAAPGLKGAKVSPTIDESWTIAYWRRSPFHNSTGSLPPGPIGDQAVRRTRGVVLASSVATVPAGARRTARVRLTAAGRTLLGVAARAGTVRLRLRLAVAMTSGAGAFAPSTAERAVALRVRAARAPASRGRPSG